MMQVCNMAYQLEKLFCDVFDHSNRLKLYMYVCKVKEVIERFMEGDVETKFEIEMRKKKKMRMISLENLINFVYKILKSK